MMEPKEQLKEQLKAQFETAWQGSFLSSERRTCLAVSRLVAESIGTPLCFDKVENL
jgi:hypothetical protein